MVLPIARAHHLLLPPLIGCEQKWLAKGLSTGATTLKDEWQGYTYFWHHWEHLTDTIFRRVLIMHSGFRQVGSDKKTFEQMSFRFLRAEMVENIYFHINCCLSDL